KPWFSVSSYKTFGPDEEVEIHANYHDVDRLDFRIYKVRDPIQFFQQLEELHAYGPSTRPRQPKSRIETLHTFKQSTFHKIKNYFRTQLSLNTRKAVLHTFTGQPSGKRPAVKGAQFASVPLLNPSQVVRNWQEALPPPRDDKSYYMHTSIPVDLKEKGVYLV